jgi:molybdenum cofactor biosynthesis protein B
MSVDAHRAASPAAVRCFVLTVSDTRRLDTETSGRVIADLLAGAGHVVVDRALVRDEPAEVVEAVRGQIASGAVDAVITTGGTGLSPRDTTREALEPLFEQTIDGFGELFRKLSYEEIGAASMLSRATAGVIGGCPVFLLPGSEAGVRLAVSKLIAPELGHILGQMRRRS